MPLLLVTGRANAGKTGAAHDAIRAAAREGRSAVLIVPSDPDAERARRELGRDVPLGLRVVTFQQHASATWASHGDGRSVVTTGQRQLLLSRIRAAAGPILPGYDVLASQAIDQLTDSLGTGWRDRAAEAAGFARDLKSLVTSYAEALDRLSLVEPGEVYSLLSEREAYGGDLLVVHRFTDFTGAQERFLIAAATTGIDVLVTLPWEEGFAPTAALDPLVGRLSLVGELASCAEDVLGTDPELVRLGSDLFGSPEALSLTDSVRFSEVEGEEAQADRIAAEVAAAIAEGSAPHEVAVVFRDPVRHAGPLAAALADLGIDADFDILVPFARTPFGKAFLQALRFARTEDPTAILGYARSAFAGMSNSEQERFERAVRTRGLVGRARILSELAEIAICASGLVTALGRAVNVGVDAEAATLVARAARSALGYAHSSGFIVERAELDGDARAVRALTVLLEDSVALGEPPITALALETALVHHGVGPGDVEHEGRVQVTSVERARARRFDVVVLGGLCSGEFPKMADETFAAGGAAGDFLVACGVGSVHSLGSDYERLLLYQVVTRPRRRLIVVRRSADSEGIPVTPSVFWEELLDFYRPAREDSGQPDGIAGMGLRDCALAPASSPSVRRALRTAVTCGGGETHPRAALALSKSLGGPAVLGDLEALTELSKREIFSTSEIEAYLACPLRWFYERVVRPQQLDFEFDARERGRLAHEMLRAAYEAIRREIPEGRVTVGNLETAQRVVDKAVAAVEAHTPTPRDFEGKQQRRELYRTVSRLLKADATQLPGSFKPHLLEWAFGGDDGVDFGSFRLRGRIDRVDTDGERAVIIDYKTGDVCARAKLLEEGKVQTQLYAEVVRREQGLQPVGSVYWSLKGGKPRGLVDVACLDQESFTSTDCGDASRMREDIEEALKLASSAVEGIRRAEIAPRPRQGACDWCSATALCGRCRQ